MSAKKLLIGETFGELTVIAEAKKRISNRVTWTCLCSCGKYKDIISKHLTTGVTKTCRGVIHYTGNNSKSWKGTKSICGKYFSQVKRGALARELSFNITIQDMENLAKEQGYKCNLTGMLLNFDTNHNGTASLDRIDSNRGYEANNIQWLHKDINRMKQEFSTSYFLSLCKSITQYANTN